MVELGYSRSSDDRRAIDALEWAGLDRVDVHRVGPDQASFIDFSAREIALALAQAA